MIKKVLEQQRKFFLTGKTRDINYRIEMLKRLKQAVKENENEICEALHKDLGKEKSEAYMTEIGVLYDEINCAIKNVKKWAKPKKVKTPIYNWIASSYIYSEPYGSTLIIAPFNYPFQLAFSPLVGAIVGGNCAVLKPSEFAEQTAILLEKIVSKYFEPHYITVMNGDVEVNKKLLEQKFDHIFFTGSVNVGKVVMEAAAKHLTPVTLELGGKSPCIVDATANIDIAARRIVWGKLLNVGQTCVAPDYIYVDKKVKDALIDHMKKYILQFYGKQPCESKDFGKIINIRHFNRLVRLIEGEKIVYGGKYNQDALKIEPTILEEITWDSPIMQEEIFGPLFPILTYDKLQDVVAKINEEPKPLACYFFSENKKAQDYILNHVSFGGGCINDTIMHVSSSHLPFGGVGNSGMGAYHGKASFEAFTHKKGVVKKSNFLDLPLRYPPYKKEKLNIVKLFLK